MRTETEEPNWLSRKKYNLSIGYWPSHFILRRPFFVYLLLNFSLEEAHSVCERRARLGLFSVDKKIYREGGLGRGRDPGVTMQLATNLEGLILHISKLTTQCIMVSLKWRYT